MSVNSAFSLDILCRICLSRLNQDEIAYDLFGISGLAEKLMDLVLLSVEPNDGYPRKLCSNCYQRLNELHIFRLECLSSKQKFQRLIDCNFIEMECDIKLPESVILPQEDDEKYLAVYDVAAPLCFDPLLNCDGTHKTEEIYCDNSTNDDGASASASASVSVSVGDEVKIDFEPVICADNSITKGRYLVNNVDVDEDELPLARRLRKKPALKFKIDSYYTDDSGDDSSEDGCDKHVEKDVKKCLKINRKRKKVVTADVETQHIIECHICHQKFKKAKRYDDHMKHHNDLLPFQCQVETCRKGFTTSNGLRLHVDHAHTELAETHACTVAGCERTFPRIRLLTWHLRKAHNILKAQTAPRTYPCMECDKVFRCPMALKKHNYKHDGKELPFPCNICGKRFVINSALKDHLMRHAGIKNYVCPHCGVGKTTRQEWNTHILTHTQEKKFKCHLCEHASHNKQSLANHIKIVHEKIKNYACQYCGKTFGKSHACKIHEMTHTGEKRCECKVCGKRFLYPKSLTKHLKTHEKRVLRALETYNRRQKDLGESAPENGNATDTLLKVCAESVATIPKDPRRVELVDIAQLAGTVVNPITSVSVPSCPTEDNFTKKEGKHICPGCGQGFNNIGNMKRHFKIIHERVKDFACRFCPRRFAKSQTLKHHEWTHTGEKPYECKTCGTRFRQDVALKRHQKVHQLRPPVIPLKFYAAKEELQVQERKKLEAKRKVELEREAIAAAAKIELELLSQQESMEKKINSYDKYMAVASTAAENAQNSLETNSNAREVSENSSASERTIAAT